MDEALIIVPPIKDSVWSVIKGTVPQYPFAVAVIYIGFSGTKHISFTIGAWLGILIFLALTYHMQLTTLAAWRLWGDSPCAEPWSYKRAVHPGQKFFGTPAQVRQVFEATEQVATILTIPLSFNVGGRDARISKASFSLIAGMPTTVQALTNGLVVGQAFGLHLREDLWLQGWKLFPIVGTCGYPLTCLIVNVGFYIFAAVGVARESQIALRTNCIKNLAHSADCANLAVLGDFFHLLHTETDTAFPKVTPNQVAARFLTKVIGACIMLWLKISLWGLAPDQTILERFNLAVAIAMSYFVILQALPGQYETVLRTLSEGISCWSFTNVLLFAFAIWICAACMVRLGGAAMCRDHYFNIIGWKCV